MRARGAKKKENWDEDEVTPVKVDKETPVRTRVVREETGPQPATHFNPKGCMMRVIVHKRRNKGRKSVCGRRGVSGYAGR